MGEQLKLTPYLISDTRLSSTIVTDKGVRVGTIGHIMSALSAYGIDNALIELNALKSRLWTAPACRLFTFARCGRGRSKGANAFLKILKPVEIKEAGKWCALRRMTALR